ncbi:MAG: choice-of-anchor tandem repeat GloVer-containing protein, partial [Candidatus Cybelea sp.]
TLYGVTTAGGLNKSCIYSSSPPGCGVIFALDSSGHEKVIYRFKGPPDGAIPLKALFPFDGKLYGTTFYGGRCSYSAGGCGTVFGVTTSGKESVIYSFEGGHDGQSPNAPLVALNGSLWGTTFQGGCVKSCQYGTFGTIFKMSTSGHETIVHRFTDLPDGAFPQGPLAVVNNTIYSTTSSGGARRRAGGTIYSATSKGVQILHSFGAAPNGDAPGLQGLSLDDSTKALYGLTIDGGTHEAGTIFRFTP